jgi:hypothetical protein
MNLRVCGVSEFARDDEIHTFISAIAEILSIETKKSNQS